jgi:CRISPR-associated protein Cmr5
MEKTTVKKDCQRERASFAWKSVNDVYAGARKDYRSVVRKFPSQIATNGLGLSLAFLISKKGEDAKRNQNAYWLVYSQIQEWLCDKTSICKTAKTTDCKLIEWLVDPETKTGHYRYATTEALSLAEWLKRFAEAVVP